ncbi:hypothetical protein [Nesterenkonia flava]|uniref:DUF1795 domain-containing protein n=1 Tax=Nesterenkonia flava TaxID=469799 RepID=A0ABU1FQM4_9MICC|nr:hypothetical protein [Nesterenkonia flava]MDR5710941.1 hypothetical protein [Nesterenkonia flava]
MNTTQRYTRPPLVYSLELPPSWEVDDSGIDSGLVLARDTQGWGNGFHPNIVLTQSSWSGSGDATPETVLATQQSLEETFSRQLQDYRLIHLDFADFGTVAREDGEGEPVPGIMRAAYYTNEEGVPLMMHQWAARRAGVELSMTVTFPASDLPVLADASWSLAGLLEWKPDGRSA